MNLRKLKEKDEWLECYVAGELDKVEAIINQHEFLIEYVDWARLQKSFYALGEQLWAEREIDGCLE